MQTLRVSDATDQPSVAICIPVRDELSRLPALLRSLANQQDVSLSFAVCLLFDGPQQASVDVASAMARTAPFSLFTRTIARRSSPNAGRARRAALTLGQAAIGGNPHGVLLTTDADSIPAANWVANSSNALRKVDLVAGYIGRHNPRRLAVRFRHEAYLDRLHQIERTIDPIDYEPAPSHPSIGGASLGFRAAVYQALGGFAEQPAQEDVAIVVAARRRGYRVCRDRRVCVTTSSRRRGRANGGLADELHRGHLDCTLPEVEHPLESVARYQRRAAARAAFSSHDRPTALRRLAVMLAQPYAQVAETAVQAPSADAFTLCVVPVEVDCRAASLAEAEIVLSELEAEYHDRAV